MRGHRQSARGPGAGRLGSKPAPTALQCTILEDTLPLPGLSVPTCKMGNDPSPRRAAILESYKHGAGRTPNGAKLSIGLQADSGRGAAGRGVATPLCSVRGVPLPRECPGPSSPQGDRCSRPELAADSRAGRPRAAAASRPLPRPAPCLSFLPAPEPCSPPRGRAGAVTPRATRRSPDLTGRKRGAPPRSRAELAPCFRGPARPCPGPDPRGT